MIYRIFSNLFYTGDFEWNGKRYKGIHEPMITRDEFDRAQKIIGRDGKPRSQKYFHSYTGAVRCGECGCLHTALLKRKLIKKTGLYKDFVYYYCTRRKKDIVCSQRATLTKQELESQIARIIEGINIAPEFLQWALDYLRENNEIEVEDKEKIKEELGDVLWYIASMCHCLGMDLKDVAAKNVEKLMIRYPNGFDTERSKNREK